MAGVWAAVASMPHEDPLVAAEDNDVVKMKVKSAPGGPDGDLLLQIRRQDLKKLELTQDDVVAGGEVVGGSDGRPLQLKVKGRYFPLPEPQQSLSSVVVFHSVESEEPYLLDLNTVGNLTLHSFDEDPTLVGVAEPRLDWSLPTPCPLQHLVVNVSARQLVIDINHTTVLVEAQKRSLVLFRGRNGSGSAIREEDLWQGGLHMLVINPHTSQVTFSQMFQTSDFGGHRDLSWSLRTIQHGRLVVLTSVHDGSLHLGPARQNLHALGSEWALHYLFRDSWAWVFFMGGRTLAETINPNMGNSSVAASPLMLRVEIPQSSPAESRFAETVSPIMENSSVAALPLLLRVEVPRSSLGEEILTESIGLSMENFSVPTSSLLQQGQSPISLHEEPFSEKGDQRSKIQKVTKDLPVKGKEQKETPRTGAKAEGRDKELKKHESLNEESLYKGKTGNTLDTIGMLDNSDDVVKNGTQWDQHKKEEIMKKDTVKAVDEVMEGEAMKTGGCNYNKWWLQEVATSGDGRKELQPEAARRVFCTTHDGYSDLCYCEKPFTLARDTPHTRPPHWREDIPIIILAGNRTRYLYRLLRSVGQQAGLQAQLVLLVTDGVVDDVLKLAHILQVNVIIHRPEGQGAARVSRNLRFAFFSALRIFPRADKFILLEDDLVLSPDFYSYMQQSGWVLDNDPSVYCVSAYNHFSYDHTAHDPSRVYRVHSFPSYGWMVTRDTLAYILPKWLPSNITHDWDYFLATSVMRRGRECLVPEVNRAYHGGGTGVHLSASWSTERDYLSRPYNHNPNVTLMQSSRLLQEVYEEEMVALLRTAVPIDVNDAVEDKKLLSLGGVYVIYVEMKHDKDLLAFRDIAEKLGVWSRDGRDSHHLAWRLDYHNATLFLVGAPASRYWHFRRRGAPVMGASEGAEEALRMQDVWALVDTPPITHASLPFMPVGAVMVPLAPIALPQASLESSPLPESTPLSEPMTLPDSNLLSTTPLMKSATVLESSEPLSESLPVLESTSVLSEPLSKSTASLLSVSSMSSTSPLPSSRHFSLSPFPSTPLSSSSPPPPFPSLQPSSSSLSPPSPSLQSPSSLLQSPSP